MTDTLKQRAEEFRRWDYLISQKDRVSDHSADCWLEKFIAEIRWARENPPKPHVFGNTHDYGWQSFADHLLACLGEK